MQARRHDSDADHHGIDLAPMLDFVLNLLIFFIIITDIISRVYFLFFYFSTLSHPIHRNRTKQV